MKNFSIENKYKGLLKFITIWETKKEIGEIVKQDFSNLIYEFKNIDSYFQKILSFLKSKEIISIFEKIERICIKEVADELDNWNNDINYSFIKEFDYDWFSSWNKFLVFLKKL